MAQMTFHVVLTDLDPFYVLSLLTAVSLPVAYFAGRSDGRRNAPPVLRHGVPAKPPTHAVEAAARGTAEEHLEDSDIIILDFEVRTLRAPFEVVAVVADDEGITTLKAFGDTVAEASRRLADRAARRDSSPRIAS
jgi:hypothetical protein